MAGSSVKVAVRARPFNKREIEMGAQIILSMEDNTVKIINKKLKNEFSIDKHTVKNPFFEKQFSFNHAYWSVSDKDDNFVKQEQIYDDLGSDVVKSAMIGYNACIFAYGQTGAGKTFTMMGDRKKPGLIPRISENLFAKFENRSETSYRVEISYIEIYNEQVRDLLRTTRPASKEQKTLKVREHPKEGPFVQGVTVHPVSDFSQMEHYMEVGNSVRVTASTMMNDTSSRSHAIFCIKFTQARFSDNVPSETVSKINLVDLAGSERASASGATGVRLKEGGSINKSLTTLGLVISTLADNSTNTTDGKSPARKHTFVPYRDSVLTWLLKDSLGGNSKTIMIAAISPADINYGETLSTLRYASRAMKIINRPQINEDPNVKLIRELRAEIERLKEMIHNGGMENAYTRTVSEAIEAKLADNEQKADELTKSWRNRWQETEAICQEEQLTMRRQGRQTLLISEKPHLVGIDVDPLSAEIVIYRLEDGVTVLGSGDLTEEQGIALHGSGIEKDHCRIQVCENGKSVHLKPVAEKCFLNGLCVDGDRKLTQGDIIKFGDSLKFRFNNPKEAAMLLEKRRSGNFSAEFSMNYTQDRSLDSGLSCPDEILCESPDLTLQVPELNYNMVASCPDLAEQQRKTEYSEADTQTSPEHPPLCRTAPPLPELPDLPEEDRFSPSDEMVEIAPQFEFSTPPRTFHSTPITGKMRRWSHGDSDRRGHLAVDRTFSLNKKDFDDKRELVRDMMNKYRKKEVIRIERDRQYRNKIDKKLEHLKKEKSQILAARGKQENSLTIADQTLKEQRAKFQHEKMGKRRMVEKYIDRVLESMRSKGKAATPDVERELAKRKFQIRSKVEEFWKKMDLYENCLLAIELERRGHGTSHGDLDESNDEMLNGVSHSEDKRKAIPKEIGKLQEQGKILEELLARHHEALISNESKIEHIDNVVEGCKSKYSDRLIQANALLKELEDQRVLTSDLIDKEKATEESKERSDSQLVHTLRYVNSVSSPLHIEREVSSKPTMFTFQEEEEETFESHDLKPGPADSRNNGHAVLNRTLSKSEKLEVRRDKYELLIKEAQRSIIELKSARNLEIDQYTNEKEETINLCSNIKQRIEGDNARLSEIKTEIDAMQSAVSQTEEGRSTVELQKEQLLQSRTKIIELFENSLHISLNDASTEMRELHRNSWGSFGITRSRRYAGVNEMLDCVMKSVEVDNLDEIAEKEARLAALKEDLNDSETKLREVEEKEASLQNVVLHQLEKRKVRSDISRVKHYQEISRSVEQLMTIAEGKDPAKVTQYLSTEAQHLAKSRERLEDLEKSMLSKVKESKDLQSKMRKAQERLKSTSSELEDYDDAIDCRIELELEELEFRKGECDHDIDDLHKRLDQERKQYLDILRCRDDYVIIGKEYREARQIMMKVLGNQAAADVQKEVFWASNAMDLIEQGIDPLQSPVCGGWRPFAREKDVTIMRKILPKAGVQCFIGCGVIKVAPNVVWESVRNPLSRFIYDSLLKKINVVEHAADHLKVVYMRHEGRVCVMKHSRDFCMIHAERDQSDMMIAASQSVDHPDCPELPSIIRAKLLPSGWAVEPYMEDGNEWSLVWYVVKVDLGGTLPNTLMNFLCRRLPLSIAYLRSYLILT